MKKKAKLLFESLETRNLLSAVAPINIFSGPLVPHTTSFDPPAIIGDLGSLSQGWASPSQSAARQDATVQAVPSQVQILPIVNLKGALLPDPLIADHVPAKDSGQPSASLSTLPLLNSFPSSTAGNVSQIDAAIARIVDFAPPLQTDLPVNNLSQFNDRQDGNSGHGDSEHIDPKQSITLTSNSALDLARTTAPDHGSGTASDSSSTPDATGDSASTSDANTNGTAALNSANNADSFTGAPLLESVFASVLLPDVNGILNSISPIDGIDQSDSAIASEPTAPVAIGPNPSNTDPSNPAPTASSIADNFTFDPSHSMHVDRLEGPATALDPFMRTSMPNESTGEPSPVVGPMALVVNDPQVAGAPVTAPNFTSIALPSDIGTASPAARSGDVSLFPATASMLANSPQAVDVAANYATITAGYATATTGAAYGSANVQAVNYSITSFANANSTLASNSSFVGAASANSDTNGQGGFISIDDGSTGLHLGSRPAQSTDAARVSPGDLGSSGRASNAATGATSGNVNRNSTASASESIMLQAADGSEEGGGIELAVDAPTAFSLADSLPAAGNENPSANAIRAESGIGTFCDVDVAVVHDSADDGSLPLALSGYNPGVNQGNSIGMARMSSPGVKWTMNEQSAPDIVHSDLAGKLPLLGCFAILIFADGIHLEETSPLREQRFRTLEALRRV